MNKKIVLLLFAASLLFGPDGNGAEKSAKSKLAELVGKIQGKLKDGQNTETDLAEELKQFDVLLDQHKDEKSDDVAQILLMKAMLYVEVLDNTEKALQSLKQLKSDFPGTEQTKNADDVIAAIQKQEEAKKIQRSLVVSAKFPDFEEKDVFGKPLSIANYKGKVVLLDFWATWCGPCIAELPNVLKTYEKYHAKGFEMIGISLDKDEQTLTSFIKKRNMPWQQFFDGKGWGNKLAVKYGINSIPMTYLLDGEGKIVAMNLRGEELDAVVAKTLKP